MATLTLKRKAVITTPTTHPRTLIANTTRENLVGKFAVTRQQTNVLTSRFTSIHDTQAQAEFIAELMLEETPGARYLLIQIVKAIE